MGKTKIKVIDDSALVEKEKPSKKRVEKAERAKVGEDVNLQEKSEISEEKVVVDDSADKTPPTAQGKSESSKIKKPGKAKPRSKKYQEKVQDLDRSKTYSIDEAVEMTKKLSYSKFTGTLEAHINTIQTGLRGLISLPYASGKKLTILAFGKGAGESGADIFGDDSTLEEIEKGKINFDLVITTPDWMPKLAKVAKVLGPRGLIPNPKNGTITSGEDGLKKAVEGFQSGKTEYKTEAKAPVIHLALGKLNQPTEELSANVKTLLFTLGKSRIKKVTLSPTIGPSVKVDLSSI